MSDQKPQGRTAPPNEGLVNIAKIFIQWKSKNEKFSYYSKEKEVDVMLPMPFTFIPLHVCHTVKGYNHKKTKTFIANEVENLSTDVLTLTSYNNVTKERKIESKGLYADIKEGFDQNVKFTESIYAALKNKKGELSIVNLQLNGAGLHHWFDFIKKNDIWKGSVKVTETTDEKNGDVKYKAPVYEIDKISQADDIKAGELQGQIKEYLAKYFAKNATSTISESKAESNTNDSSKSTSKDAAFDDSKHKDAQTSKTTTKEEKVSDIVFGDADAPDDF